jgi:hypothetical protein
VDAVYFCDEKGQLHEFKVDNNYLVVDVNYLLGLVTLGGGGPAINNHTTPEAVANLVGAAFSEIGIRADVSLVLANATVALADFYPKIMATLDPLSWTRVVRVSEKTGVFNPDPGIGIVLVTKANTKYLKFEVFPSIQGAVETGEIARVVNAGGGMNTRYFYSWSVGRNALIGSLEGDQVRGILLRDNS